MQRLLATVCARVRRTMQLHEMVRPNERVLVAVSGGADSVGLLAILSRLRRRAGIELVAAHVNHALRGVDSDADEGCAAAAAASLEVSFVRTSLAATLAPGGNLEERARDLRYAALLGLAAENGCARVATGHTQDDQAETLLLRLIRGSGPAGLSAIRPRRADGVIRPLLDCRRADVERTVRALGLAYRHDRSNDDPRYLRTQVRGRLVPLLLELNPAIVATLARTAALEREQAEVIDGLVAARLAELPDALAVDELLRLPGALRARLLARWLDGRGVGRRVLSARHLEAILELARRDGPGGSLQLPGGVRLVRRGGLLRLGTPPPAARPEARPLAPGDELQWPGGWRLESVLLERNGEEALPSDLWSAVCDADALAAPLVVRPARRGERVRPLGLGGSRKLSDAFIDRRVPRDERAAYPVVACREEIVWIPGVLRAECFRVGPATRRAVWLRAERAAVS